MATLPHHKDNDREGSYEEASPLPRGIEGEEQEKEMEYEEKREEIDQKLKLDTNQKTSI